MGLFGMEVAEAANESCDCQPEKRKKHLGGNPVHDMCADAYSETFYKGGDVTVAGKNYDALDRTVSPPDTLYEMKTGTSYSRWKHVPKFGNFIKSRSIYEYYYELVLARSCGYEFKFIAKDSALVGDMKAYFIANGRGVDAARVAVGCP